MDNNETNRPFAAAAERRLKPMITTHLKAEFYAMTAITARQSFASIAVTESGQMTMQALIV